MPRISALLERLSQALCRPRAAEQRVAEVDPSPLARPRRRTNGTAGLRSNAGPSPLLLEQLAMDLGPARPRWTFSRLAARTPHHARIVEHLEFARRFFPELAGITIHVGLAQKRGVLGWGSLDPERPGVWVRPRRLHLFTIAHEFTHLLQARGLVPRGERQCDLFALAREPLLVDRAPGYLRLPRALGRGRPTPEQAHLLCDLARRALRAREAGERRYVLAFERELSEVMRRG